MGLEWHMYLPLVVSEWLLRSLDSNPLAFLGAVLGIVVVVILLRSKPN